MPSAEKRSSGPGSIPVVTLRFADWPSFLEGYSKDLAHGGLFLQQETPLPVFSQIQVRLVLPERTPPLLLPATVVHVTAPGGAPGRSPGIGVQLSALPEETSRALKELVRLARRKTGLDGTDGPVSRTMPGLPAINTMAGQSAADPAQILPILREQLAWFSKRDPASALGLSEPFDLDAARRVYFKLCKRYHPDLYTRYHHRELTDVVTALFAAIQNAYAAIEARLSAPPAPSARPPAGRGP